MLPSTRFKHFTLTQLLLVLVMTGPTGFAQEPNNNSQGSETNKATEAQTEKTKTMAGGSTRKTAVELLSEEIDDGNLNWLDSASGKFMGLWQRDKSDTTYGAILILHGDGQSAEWPHSVKALRKNLSLHGWATLAIALPNTDKPEIPPRPAIKPEMKTAESDSKPPEAKNMDTPPPEKVQDSEPSDSIMAESKQTKSAEEISKDRLESSINFLKEKGQYNIVIVGHGNSAIRAAKYIYDITSEAGASQAKMGKMQRPIRALIFIEARNHVTPNNKSLTTYLNDPNLPILDIYFGDHFLDHMETRKRKVLAREKNIKHYYQLKVLRPSDSTLDNENRLTRRVRGFLNKHAKGVEIDRRG